MAVWEPRDWQACSAHWQRILNDPSVNTRAVLLGENVAGYVAAFDREGKREVCYWIGTEFWGRGVASGALGAFLASELARPLLARVAQSNSASIRVLEKHGFDVESRQLADDGVPEVWLVLND